MTGRADPRWYKPERFTIDPAQVKKDGHHRIGAALLAGLPFLPAIVLATA